MKHIACVALLMLAACAAPRSDSPSSEPIIIPSTTENVTTPYIPPTSTESAQPPAVRQSAVYSISATLDYAAHYLAVRQQITYFNNTSLDLTEIPLLFEAEKKGALLTINSLEFDRGTEWDYETQTGIVVTLARPLSPGEKVTLDLDYSLALPEGFRTLGWSERQTNFVDWYPFIPPYRDGQEWLINAAAPQGEHLAYESANFDVQITILNAPALTRIAAPAPAIENSVGTFTYHLENARRFSWSASGNYEVESMRANTGTPVTVYFFEEDRDAAEASMRAAAQAVEIYSALFGSYPYESLSIVECNFPDGMESDGLFFLDRDYFRRYDYRTTNLLTTLSAHETAHNWWYGSVGNDPAHEPWLDEALATYSELLFYERYYPGSVAWWWEFRVNQWDPTGWVDSTAYELTNFRPYVNAVYLRGVLFLRDLREAMGNEAFLAFLKEYAQQGAGQVMTSEKFFSLLTDSTDEDLASILGEYFRSADYN